MATTIGTLEIEMAANIARLSADLGAARNEVNRTMGEIQRSVSSVKPRAKLSRLEVETASNRFHLSM